MTYARKIAEEDANASAAILEEDLNQDDAHHQLPLAPPSFDHFVKTEFTFGLSLATLLQLK
jgi:hypothetical protein